MDKTERANLFFTEKPQNNVEIIVVCYELHTPDNVGAIMRLCGNFNVKKMIICDDNFNLRIRKMRANATNSFDTIDWEIMKTQDCFDAIPKDYHIIGIEICKQAKEITKYIFPEKIALVVGNERYGLPEKALSYCNDTVIIPMHGIIKSMNVSQALCVALYENFRQKQ